LTTQDEKTRPSANGHTTQLHPISEDGDNHDNGLDNIRENRGSHDSGLDNIPVKPKRPAPMVPEKGSFDKKPELIPRNRRGSGAVENAVKVRHGNVLRPELDAPAKVVAPVPTPGSVVNTNPAGDVTDAAEKEARRVSVVKFFRVSWKFSV